MYESLKYYVLLLMLFGNMSCKMVSYSRQHMDKSAKDELYYSQLLETVKVGPIPDGKKLNVFFLLSLVNVRSRENKLPAVCRVTFTSPPDIFVSENDFMWGSITDWSVYNKEDREMLLSRIGIHSTLVTEQHLAMMNLRQLLWLLCRVYQLDIKYEKCGIVVGYGFESNMAISPGFCIETFTPEALTNQTDPFRLDK